MGVTVEVWRMQIGTFSSRPPKAERRHSSSSSDPTTGPFSMGIGCKTFLIVLLAVAIGEAGIHQLSKSCNPLLVCGDIELNPGPSTPTLPEDLLDKLKNADGSILPLNFDLLNGHIIQLNNLKKRCGASWSTYAQWITTLKPEHVANDDGWARRFSVQSKSLLAAYEKLKKNKQRKEGKEQLEEWKQNVYVFPEISGPRPNEPKPSCFDISDLKIQNEQLIKENEDLKQKVKTLSERPDAHAQTLQKRRETYHKTQSSSLRKEHMNLEKDYNKLSAKRQKIEAHCSNLNKEVSQARDEVMETKEDAFQTNTILTDQINKQSELIKQLREHNAMLKTKLEEQGDVIQTMQVDAGGKSSYRPEVRACIYKLLQFHVSFDNVSDVITTVLTMIGKKADKLPTGKTVSRFNEERLLLAQKQLRTLTDKQDLTLSTDETPKAGDIYMTYTINDQDQNTYVLGLREMVSKSAEDTLTILKEILSDINDICKTEHTNDTGHQILLKIKNTMSDRAATEALFNDMLQTYRKECLPLYTKGWDKFSTAAKEKLLHMNNFFCGLHLLVSMAETISASLKEFEDQFFDGKHPGAPNVPGVGGFINHSESGTVRLIRTCTKALAKGGDEKSGVHRHWKTFKRRENITKRYLQVFRGNRFNIVFLLGGCVHFLHEKVFYFLDKVQGTTNRLLMAVHADIQQPVFLAGCKVLGLLNKLVTTPLWRVTESDGHIIDLCDQYTKLHNFFSECLEKDTTLFKFMKGEVSPFEDNLVNKDEVYDSLITETQNDEIAMSMARFTFTALKQLLGRVVKDFLPGGQYYDLKVNKEFLQQTLSVPKHNKLPERVFGYLDFLLKKRPNVRSITNEAQVMFTFNKTAKYMDSLTPEQLHREIQEVMVKRKDLQEVIKKREEQRHKALLVKQIDKQKKLEQAELNKLKAREKLTSIIIDAGLWQSRQAVDSKMHDCDSDRERLNALKNQIQFRRKLLHQYMPSDKGFTFSKGGKDKPWIELRNHLYSFIDAALSVADGQSVTRTVPDEPSVAIPLLVGKSVIHYFHETDENDQEVRVPYNGKVISQVPGFLEWFNIAYENDDAVYSYQLIKDYQEQNLEIVPE